MEKFRKITWIFLQLILISCGLTASYFLHQHKIATDNAVNEILNSHLSKPLDDQPILSPQPTNPPQETIMVRADLFQYTVNQLRGGAAQADLSTALNEVVKACQLTNKAGKLTLELSIKPQGQGTYFLSDEIKTKIPKLPKNSTLLWGTPEGNLQKYDPAQGELELRAVGEPTQAPKTITDDAAPVKVVA